jgi:Lipocalin-like domain
MTAPNPLLGAWKLISFQTATEDGDERRDVYDPHPLGCLVITENRFTAILTASDQPRDADGAVLFERMTAYTGRCRIESDKIITTVDVSWHPAWLGSEQIRFFKVDGDRLSISSLPQHHPKFPGRLVRGIVVWQKE